MKKNIIWYALGLGALYFLVKGKGTGNDTPPATSVIGPVNMNEGTPSSGSITW